MKLVGKEGSDLKRSLSAIGHECDSSIDCLIDLTGYVVHSLHRVLMLSIIFGTYNLISFDRLKIGKLTMRNIVNVAGLAEAAAALQREANLPRSITPPNVLPAQPCVFSSPHLASPRIVSFTLH